MAEIARSELFPLGSIIATGWISAEVTNLGVYGMKPFRYCNWTIESGSCVVKNGWNTRGVTIFNPTEEDWTLLVTVQFQMRTDGWRYDEDISQYQAGGVGIYINSDPTLDDEELYDLFEDNYLLGCPDSIGFSGMKDGANDNSYYRGSTATTQGVFTLGAGETKQVVPYLQVLMYEEVRHVLVSGPTYHSSIKVEILDKSIPEESS